MSLTPEEIEANWKRSLSLLEKLGDRRDPAVAMFEALGERLALCPASAKSSYHCSFPGGLVDHSLRVLGNAMKLRAAFGWEVELPKASMIIGALCHDLGKVGSQDSDYYVPQTDQWRVDKLGEEYTYNKELAYMTVPDRGVFLCQHFGLKLTHDETLAIRLNDGWVVEANKGYCLKEPLLAHVIMTADYVSCMQEKGMFP